MYKNSKKIKLLLWLLIVFILIIVNFFILSNTLSQAVEDKNVDVILKLEVPSSATAGSDFTYVATVTNKGPDSADGTKIRMAIQKGTKNVTVECVSENNGATCLTNILVDETNGNITADISSLPRNGELIFNVKGKFPNNKSSASINFEATVPDGVTDADLETNTVEQQTSLLIIPDITVTKTQDKESVGLGEERTYTITYQNNSDFDIPISTADQADFGFYNNRGEKIGVFYADVNVTTTCDVNESTMDCPSDFQVTKDYSNTYTVNPYNKNGNYDNYVKVTIPAGKKLVLKSVIRLGGDVCGNHDIKVVNEMRAVLTDSSHVFADGQRVVRSKVTGDLVCADVSTTTNVAKSSILPSERQTIISVVDNSVGRAENIPFEMQLPVNNDKKILDGTDFTPVCIVTKGNAQCPTDLRYEPVTNKVLGTIPSMGSDSGISITMETVFTESGRFTESYIVTSQVAPVKGDLNLGTEGVNRSSDTFAWDNYKVIPFPSAPETDDPCGPNNIRWVKPADTDQVRWEIKDDGHAWVYVKPGYLFTGDARNKDYGVATGDSNTACPVTEIPVPPAPHVDDQCGPGNASWVVPADSDQVRYELTGDKHLVVHVKDGYRFEGDKISHDYGVAPDSNEPCPPTEIDFPPAPQINDQCGSDNAVWVEPGVSDQVIWNLVDNGRRITTTVKDGYIFSDGSSVKDYGIATDSNDPCPPTVISVPPAPHVDDQCGPGNASWVVPADSDQVRYELTGDKHLVAHVKDGYRFEGDKVSHDYGVAPDSNEPCPPTEIDRPETPANQCTPDEKSVWSIPADTESIRYELNSEGELFAHAKEGFIFDNGNTVVNFGMSYVSCRSTGTWGMTLPPQPPKENKPFKSVEPTPNNPPTPVLVKKKLVDTGVDSSIGYVSLMTLVAGLGLVVFSRRKQTK